MKKISALSVLITITIVCFSQSKTLEVNPAAGDVFTTSDISLSWTIGEGVIETFSNNEIVLTQGFQQPSLKVTLIDESDQINFQVNIYPNPTRDLLTINMQSENEIACTAELFDMSGKLLFRKDLTGREITETLDLSSYSSNVYILRIMDTNRHFYETYKVQKVK